MEYVSLQNNDIQDADFFRSLLRLVKLKGINLSTQLRYREDKPASSVFNASIVRLKNTNATSHLLSDKSFSKDDAQPLKPYDSIFHVRGGGEERLKQSQLALSYRHHIPDTERAQLTEYFCGNSFAFRRNFHFNEPGEADITPLPRSLEYLLANNIHVAYDIPMIRIINNKVLKRFDYSQNEVKCFGGPLLGLPSLEHLDLSRNWCLRVSRVMFSELPSLNTLLLQDNVLGQSLADDVEGAIFSGLPALRTLNLSNNAIKDLSQNAFTNNKNLRRLNLSHNELSDFQPSLANTPQLLSLDLSVNTLTGLSERTCHQLILIKQGSPNFTVRINRNKFVCNCGKFAFLKLLLDQPEIFQDAETFHCRLANGSKLYYDGLADFVTELAVHCMVEVIFIVALIFFFITAAAAMVLSLYNYKQWQWKYLYYLGRSRLHIGSTYVTYRPVAHTFVTYDQDERACLRFIRTVILPHLQKAGVSFIHGQEDFEGGPLPASIAGAVASTHKTLVFLSTNIFQDYHRELEFHLATMHELYMRRPVLVPVFLLKYGQGVDRNLPGRCCREHRPRLSAEGSSDSDQENSMVPSLATTPTADHETVSTPEGSTAETVEALLRTFPPEIATFLRGQAHRCLVYDGGSEQFWAQLKAALLDDEMG